VLPANPNTNEETRNLLAMLHNLKGSAMLAAQHDYITASTKYCKIAEELTGKAPAIWGSDFTFYYEGPKEDGKKGQHCGPMNMTEPGEDYDIVDCDVHEMRMALLERIKQQFEKGHIITLMWHCPFPDKGDKGLIDDTWAWGSITDEQWQELLNPETQLHQQWIAQVDNIAQYLKLLQQWGIPVLWRPYHEMNGVWFWWCNKKGPDGFQKLWVALYERFTNHHKLNNLLWVWNTNAPRSDPGNEAYDYADYYPGGDYVDILAADVYRSDYKQSHHDQLLDLADGRPIALGEVGGLPSAEILEQQPQWLWAMPWGKAIDGWNPADEVRSFYGNPHVKSLSDICEHVEDKKRA